MKTNKKAFTNLPLVRYLVMFVAGIAVTAFAAYAANTTIETNLSQAVQFIQKIVLTDNGGQSGVTGVVIDASVLNNPRIDVWGTSIVTDGISTSDMTSNMNFSNSYCNFSWTACKTIESLLTGETDPVFLANSGAAFANNYANSLSFSGTNTLLTLGRTGMAVLTATIDLGWAKDVNGFSSISAIGIGRASMAGVALIVSWSLIANTITTDTFSSNTLWLQTSFVSPAPDTDLYVQWGEYREVKTGNVILGANGGMVQIGLWDASDATTWGVIKLSPQLHPLSHAVCDNKEDLWILVYSYYDHSLCYCSDLLWWYEWISVATAHACTFGG